MQNINKFTEVYIFVPSITIRRKLPYMESRVKEIDYLKCIFITLMIIFHLVYIGDKYPYAKQIVYTFHMSAFLIISGYLANNRKDARSFLRKFLWIFIPYACMEAAYTVMSHFLPVREKCRCHYSYRIARQGIPPSDGALLVSAYTDSVQPHLLYHIPLCKAVGCLPAGCDRCLPVCPFPLGRIDELLQCPLFPYRHDSEPKRASFYTSLSRHNLRHCSIRNTMLFSRQSG